MSTANSSDTTLSASVLSRSMTISIVAGSVGMMWLTTFMPGNILNVFFKNHLGGSAFALGVLVALVHFSNFFHILAITIFSRLRHIKRYWLISHLIHRALGFVPVFVCLYILHGGDRDLAITIFIVSITLSFILHNTSSSGWLAWMAQLIPEGIRGTFFTRRTALTNLASMIWFFLVTLALDLENDNILWVFVVIFSIAAIGGIVDIVLHIFIPDPGQETDEGPPSAYRLTEPIRNSNFRRFVLAYSLFMFSMSILTPFLAPYLTAPEDIGAPNVWLGILVVITQLTTVATISNWGVIMDRFGRKPVALIGSLTYLSGIGWFFLTPDNYVFLVPVIAILSGTLNPAFVDGINQMMLTITPMRNKTTFVGWFMGTVGIANALGALTGGALYDHFTGIEFGLGLGLELQSFHVVALANLLLCSFSFLILTRIREGGEKPMGYVISRLATPGILRTFSNMGILAKPQSSGRVVRALREIYGSSGSLAVSDVIRRLDDPDADVREEAARALGRTKAPDAVEALIHRLHDPSSTIRLAAARALGQIGDPRALPVLIETLDGGSEDLQQACVQAIGQIGGADSVLRLSQLINEERSERVLTQGAEEISKHGVIEAAWEILPRMHTTANPVLRRQLAIAMGNLLGRPGEFYQYLTSDQVLQGDRVGQLFAAAGRVLGRIEKQSGQPNTVLSRLLRNIRTLAESGRYEKALEDLYGLVQKLAKIKLDLTVQDDDALLYAAVYRDIKLGLALWALKEMNELIPNTGVDADLVRIDTLLIVYFIASYRGQDPETTDRFGHLFRSPSKR